MRKGGGNQMAKGYEVMSDLFPWPSACVQLPVWPVWLDIL